MDDFFHAIYENALNTGALNRTNDPEYRRVFGQLERLIDRLCPDRSSQDELMNAIYGVLFRSDIDVLAYGFRLGVRVTAPDGL